MSTQTEQTVYLLEKDGVLLARMPLISEEFLAFHCQFEPTPEFSPYAALFAEDADLASAIAAASGDTPELLARAAELTDQILDLGLVIRREGGGVYRECLLGIDGATADFRPLNPDEEPL